MTNQQYIVALRKSAGMTRKEFCAYFGIPYRTLQDWELGTRSTPEYLLRLIGYKLEAEGLLKTPVDKDAEICE